MGVTSCDCSKRGLKDGEVEGLVGAWREICYSNDHDVLMRMEQEPQNFIVDSIGKVLSTVDNTV